MVSTTANDSYKAVPSVLVKATQDLVGGVCRTDNFYLWHKPQFVYSHARKRCCGQRGMVALRAVIVSTSCSKHWSAYGTQQLVGTTDSAAALMC
jgi:hypothetical protein